MQGLFDWGLEQLATEARRKAGRHGEQKLEPLTAGVESKAGGLLVGNQNLGEVSAPKIAELHGGGAMGVRSYGDAHLWKG